MSQTHRLNIGAFYLIRFQQWLKQIRFSNVNQADRI